MTSLCSCVTFWVELIQLLIKVLLIGLSSWRLFSMTSYPSFGSKDYAQCADTTCQVEAIAIVVTISLAVGLFIYIPIKCCVLKFTEEGSKWRPSVIFYIIFCALPCKILLLVGLHHVYTEKNGEVDKETMLVIQLLIFGLTLTTWLSKISRVKLSYYLVMDAAEDLFFAYDVWDFYDRFLDREETNNMKWLFVTVIFAFLAMFKFIPYRPTDLSDGRSKSQAQRCIWFSIFFNDLPFVVIRVTSWCLYGLEFIDIIYPLKNVFFIIFGIMAICLLNRGKIESELRDDGYLYPV